LAGEPANVLVNDEFLKKNGLEIGDRMNLTIKTYQAYNDLDVIIAGSFELFPTWYPELGTVFVGNLEYLFETIGGAVPYYVLLKTTDKESATTLDPSELRALDHRIRPVDWDSPMDHINVEKSSPKRQGFFGFLFLGYATAIGLTVLALILHLVFSFQQRAIELGTLRAAGLSPIQTILTMMWELLFMILFGVSAGTGLGYLASKIYIPYMQIVTENASSIPPFYVHIPWDTISQIYWLFGILFGISLLVTILLLRRVRLFEVIKLGETI
jgi:putative ABC transport system permease protein